MLVRCALWNEHLGCCGLIADGVVKGIEIAREVFNWPNLKKSRKGLFQANCLLTKLIKWCII